VGVVNQKHDRVESAEEIVARGRRAVALFGAERVLLTPDCGFATFADNPLASAQVAEQKLRAITRAAEILRRG
jgi:5-methyltetrahydropteroyltriglutamate--homocysteine methyltransferase